MGGDWSRVSHCHGLSGCAVVGYSGQMVTSRRDFMLASLLAAATSACRTSADTRPLDAAAEDVLRKAAPLDGAALRGAERVAGVRHTAEERAQLLATLDEQLALVQQRRRFMPDNALAPACTFDPRLPGVRYDLEAAPLRLTARDSLPLPRDDEAIAFAPVTTLSGWLRDGQLTSERLTQLYLDRLRRHGPRLECVVTLLEERALEKAREADVELSQGKVRGPLHGVPWGAKDLFDVAGARTTWGAAPYRDRVSTEDATVVERLDEAGAVLVAKLSMGALAYGDRWFDGRTRNPWNLQEGSIGSSAGPAAATAAGLVGFALGTETLGSILSPSMRCGTVGLRPTFGRVSRAGAMALCWSLDKVGPLTRTIEDAALVLDAIRGQDARDPGSLEDVALPFDGERTVEGLKVGYDPRWFEDAQAFDLDRRALGALRDAGVDLVELKLEAIPYDALLLILFAESAAAFEELTLTNDDDLLVWQEPEAWPNTFRRARFLSAVDVIQADRLRRRAMQELTATFQRVDALVSPTYAGPLLVATNFTGHPALTVPVGLHRMPTRAGLLLSNDERAGADARQGELHEVPHGLTLHGPLFREDTLLTLGLALERAVGILGLRPQLR